MNPAVISFLACASHTPKSRQLDMQTYSRMLQGIGEFNRTQWISRIAKNARWGVALSTRSGPSYLHYPMGRETIMVPVTWDEGEFPVWSPVKGKMNGWTLPAKDENIQGSG